MEANHPNYHTLLNLFRGMHKVIEEDWQNSAKQLGITQAEQHILWIIHMEKKATMSRVAEIGLWDLSTVMQIVKRLKEKQLVTTVKNDNDLRVSYVLLTGKGKKVREASSELGHRVLEFIENFFEESNENKMFLDNLHHFLREANKEFHGNDFVQWVDKTSQTLEQS
ncbi:MarR family transcriptional regulator [Alteribacillus sp. HJP-4]|uniref:MarR family transcriptional regulator n=1 Tax=Alteribacillus sp. HJP-4 TaxID=2775394 RepID=UPI0035CD0B6D